MGIDSALAAVRVQPDFPQGLAILALNLVGAGRIEEARAAEALR
jgi:hypothetical protein